jgi:hypothetical protein
MCVSTRTHTHTRARARARELTSSRRLEQAAVRAAQGRVGAVLLQGTCEPRSVRTRQHSDSPSRSYSPNSLAPQLGLFVAHRAGQPGARGRGRDGPPGLDRAGRPAPPRPAPPRPSRSCGASGRNAAPLNAMRYGARRWASRRRRGSLFLASRQHRQPSLSPPARASPMLCITAAGHVHAHACACRQSSAVI